MSLKKPANSKIRKGEEKENYLPNNNPMSGVFDLPGFGGFGGIGGGPLGGPGSANNGMTSRLSEPWEMIYNNSYWMLSMLRTVLTYAYVIHGPLRTLVDLPVYDAYRGGIRITTDEVSPEELEDFHRLLKKKKVIRQIINALRWARLYGGAGIIINTDQDYSKAFDINTVKQGDRISLIVADRWQLNWKGTPNVETSSFMYTPGGDFNEKMIVAASIHQSRVARVIGEDAPALIRQRLQGWGMSVIECVIRQMQLGFKGENAIFELIDEAKVDVWSIEGFNAQTLSKMAMGATSLRLRIATMMKNFLNAIVLDAKDKYEQKQVTFTGMAEMMQKIMILIAAACRMPVSKLFGLSATGFDSGESDLETYNAIVEGERAQAEDVMEIIIPVMMMSAWGFVPDDWKIKWPNLRVLTQEQEQNIKESNANINSRLYNEGMLNPQEYAAKNKEDGVCIMETDVAKGAEPDPPMLALETDEPLGGDKAEKKESQGKTAKKGKT